MNTNIKKYIAAGGALLLGVGGAFAQASYSGYFLENYTHRYELNPAMGNFEQKGFVGFPALNNLNVGIGGNLHVRDVLYNVDGKTCLFTNPGVDAASALSKFSNKNKVGVDLQLDILSAGWKAWGGFNAVTISAVANADVMLPKSAFTLVKEGVSNQTYDITDIRAKASGYAQIQLNHAREIKQVPGLTVGAAFKVYLGLAHADAYLNQAHLELGENAWKVRADADVYGNINGMKYKTKWSKELGRDYVDGVDFDGFGVNGGGVGLDLGGTYKWNDFEFSLAFLDLGFISWNKTMYATTGGMQEVNTDEFMFGLDKGEADQTWDELKDSFSKLYQLEDRGNIGGQTRWMRTRMNWGVQYELPYYRRLKFGMVNSTVFNGPFTTTDFRFSANVRPVDCLSASANFAAGTYGVGFGWLLNLNVTGFNFFLGMDHTLGKLAKQGVPLNSNAELSLGINFPF